METPQLFRALWGLWYFHVVRAELQTAWQRSEELSPRPAPPANCIFKRSTSPREHFALPGEFPQSREQWAQSLALYDSQQHHAHAVLSAGTSGCLAEPRHLMPLWSLGYRTKLVMSREALTLAQSYPTPSASRWRWTMQPCSISSAGSRTPSTSAPKPP